MMELICIDCIDLKRNFLNARKMTKTNYSFKVELFTFVIYIVPSSPYVHPNSCLFLF